MARAPGPPTVLSLLVLYLAVLARTVAAYTALDDDFLRRIPSPADAFAIDNGTGLLGPLLIERVPGTPGQAAAQAHLADFFRTHLPRWTVDWHNATADTPLARDVPFANLALRREPPWVRPGQANMLTLAAHYDSKLFERATFVGATDSAAPCAMLLHAARVLDPFITQMHDEMAALGEGGQIEMDMGVQILLLDGEEAFVHWSDDDSLYGSRALAQAWEQPNPPLSLYRTPLGQIRMFVLLDLLGAANPKVPSYFQTTHWAYKGLASIEERMRNLGLLETQPAQPFFSDKDKVVFDNRGAVQDDHIPFMERGVPILHLIPTPFPAVWHTPEDDGEHLDMPTTRDWAKIVTAFALEWLDMMEVAPEPSPTPGEG